MKRSSIQDKVERRVQEYGGDKDDWYYEWFQPVVQQIDIQIMNWEEIISNITEYEPESAHSIETFYTHCVEFNW